MSLFKKRYRRNFEGTSGAEYVEPAVRELMESGGSLPEAFERVASLFCKFGKRVSFERLLETPTPARVYVASEYAMHHLTQAKDEPQRVTIAGFALRIAERDGPEVRALLQSCLRMLAAHPSSRGLSNWRAFLLMQLGIQLTNSGSVAARDEALELFDQAFDALEGYLAPLGELAEIRAFQAQVRYNHGVCLAMHRHGDVTAKLRRAIELLEWAARIREGGSKPEDYRRTCHEIGACWRKLAQTGTPAEMRERLGRARLWAERAIGPSTDDRTMGSRLLMANIEVDLLLIRLRDGELNQLSFIDSVATFVEPIRPWLVRSKESLPAQTSLRRFEFLLGRTTPLSEADLVARLQGLSRQLEDDVDREIDADEAAWLGATMMAWLPRSLPPKAWPALGAIFARLHPDAVGPRMARQLVKLEIKLVGLEADPAPALRDYVTTAIARAEARLADPRLSSSERRHYAALIAGFAAKRLAWREVWCLSPIEELRWRDLCGAAAFRSDAVFFGAGVVTEHNQRDEGRWRRDLFFARMSLDILVDEIDKEALADEHAVPFSQGVMQSFDANGALTSVSAVSPSPAEAHELRQEIEGRIALGVQQGWCPNPVPAVPQPEDADLERWLQGERAILVAGPGPLLTLAHRHQDRVVLTNFPVSTSMAESIEALDRKRAAFVVPPTLTLATGRVVDAAMFEDLTPEEHAGAVPGPASLADRVAFDEALQQLFETLRPTATAIAEYLESHGLSRVVVLARFPWADVPWSSLPVANGLLGERAAIVHVPTLAALPTVGPTHPGELVYAGAALGVDPSIDLGRLAIGAAGPFNRVELERRAMTVGRLAMFVHGTHMIWPPEASGLVLDSSLPELAARWQVGEIRSIDLRGCGRAELWACQSTFGMDFIGLMRGHDEPYGIGTAFLHAGARRVVGSLWNQPSLAASLIAREFTRLAPMPGSAARDALALAQAVQAFRRWVSPDGMLAQAMRERLASGVDAELTAPQILERVVLDLLGAPEGGLKGAGESPSLLGPVAARSPHTAALGVDPAGLVEAALSPYRGPWAWAGWRITARDKEDT